MYQSQNYQNPIKPMSIGNVVSTAITLYRSHLKTYFLLALLATLWFIIIPIYGWAKYFAISGLISRLAFQELINQPESVSDARNSLKPRLWSFLRVALEFIILLFLMYLGLLFVASIAVMMISGILGLILGAVFKNPVLSGVLLGILVFAVIIGFIFAMTWFISRWLIAEVPLSIEEISGKQSIKRSWDLTKSSVIRIQGVVMIAFLVTLPMVILTGYAPSIFLVTLEEGSSLYGLVYLISWVLSLVGGAFLMPFWQTTKAVLYYDLRSRREGLDLQLRDHQ